MHPLRTSLRFIARAVLGAGAILLIAVIAAQLCIAGAMIWLGTDGGQEWIRGKIQAAAKTNGYDVAFGWIYYDTSKGLSVGDLKVADRDGPILDADRVSANIGLLSLAARSLSASMQGGTVVLYRLPQSQDRTAPPKSGPAALAPFALPDLFFRSVTLDDIAVARLDIRKDVMGVPLVLSPRLRASATLGGPLNLSLDARIAQAKDARVPWLPELIRFRGTLDPATVDSAIETLEISSAAYTIEGEGTGNLGASGSLDYTLKAALPDLAVFAPGNPGAATLDAHVTGPMTSPVLDAAVKATVENLASRGLAPVLLSLHAQNLSAEPSGTWKVTTAYKDKPATLASSFLYDAPVLLLDTITGEAPDLTAAGHLSVNTDTLLGDGAIKLDAVSLKTYADLAGIALDGRATVAATLSGADGRQAVGIDARIDKGRYDAMTLARMDLAAAIADIKIPWPRTMKLDLQGLRVSDSLRVESLSANVQGTTGGNYALTLNGKGFAAQDFSLQGGAGLTGLAQSAPAARNITLTYRAKGSALTVSGAADMDTVDLKLATRNFALRSLPVTLPDALRRATLDGGATLKGPLSAPVATADIRFSPLSAGRKGTNLNLALKASYTDKNAAAALTGTGTGIRALKASVALPLTFSLRPFVFSLPSSTPLKGTAAFDLDGKTLADAFLSPDHNVSGAIRGDGTLRGTLATPDINGNFALRDGSYTYEPYDVQLRNLALSATMDRSAVTIETLSATDGDHGTLKGGGHIGIARPSDTSVDIALNDFRLMRGDRANGVLSATLDVRGRPNGYAIGGAVKPGQFDIIIPEQFQTSIPELNIVKPDSKKAGAETLQTISLDIDVNAPNRIFVRGWGLDAEFGGDLDVTGTLNAPRIDGTFKSIRGRYEEFGKRFTLDHANLRFQGAVPPSPYLDIEAVTDAEDVTASILLTGPVAQPKIKFASTPSLPEDEVLSRILFGENLSRITPFQAIQLAQTLRRFSGKGGGGGFDPLGRLRSVTGLDDISVDTDAAGDSTVGVGKYLTDKVYLEVEKGKAESSGAANIQVEISPSVTLESKIGQDAQAGGGIVWKRDY